MIKLVSFVDINLSYFISINNIYYCVKIRKRKIFEILIGFKIDFTRELKRRDII
jgi:hypothetical protein